MLSPRQSSSPPLENNEPIPVLPPNLESENIDPNNVVAGAPQEMIVLLPTFLFRRRRPIRDY